MKAKKILVPTDFTEAADEALAQAVVIARKSGMGITLLHIEDDLTRSRLSKLDKEPGHLAEFMQKMSDELMNKEQVDCNYLTEEGDISKDICRILDREEFALMVIATHGIKGMRQKLFGSDILKIAKKATKPMLIVQEDNINHNGYSKIVFPFGGHRTYMHKVKATARIALLFDAEVHIYSIDRPFEEDSAQMKQNIADAKSHFADKGVRYLEVHEEPGVFSVGYAKQTLNYADRIGAELIAIMANSTVENLHFADADKERIICNKQNISVLSTSDEIGPDY